MRSLSLVLVAIVLTFSDRAFAWGTEGHQIIAAVAAHELTPAARAQVQELLGGGDTELAMIEVSTWADEIRSRRPDTAPWTS